jgi:hypothetical protein
MIGMLRFQLIFYDSRLTVLSGSGSFIASNPLPENAFHTPRFWLCSFGWLLGFLGNGP